MKKNLFSILFFAMALCLSFVSCDRLVVDCSRHYIVRYIGTSGFSTIKYDENGFIDPENPIFDGSIKIQWNGDMSESYAYFNTTDGSINENTLERAVFDSLADKHGDTAYYGPLYQVPVTYEFWNYTASSADIARIDIISSDDWDSEHPAGTLLNDMFSIRHVDFYGFIQKGYDKNYKFTYVEKPLVDMDVTDYYLILNSVTKPIFYLDSSSPADTDGIQHLVITIVMDDGTSYSLNCQFKPSIFQ